ncbi:MAG: hypothetical protein JSW16_07960 [Dehalococcoidales bacterium]|nr:MAG: hypothetical protein JSW16_07960 [Dehalococcoidales bacterium]
MWLIIALAGLVALLLLLLSIPLELVLRLDVGSGTRFNLRLEWLFGLITREMGKGKKKAKSVKPKRKKSRRARDFLNLMRTRGLLVQIRTLVTDVLSSLKIRRARADFTVGFDNPADTGLLLAVIGPSLILLPASIRHNILVQPSFEGGAILEGRAQAVVSLLPIRLVIPVLRFIFSLPTLRVIKKVVLPKWR